MDGQSIAVISAHNQRTNAADGTIDDFGITRSHGDSTEHKDADGNVTHHTWDHPLQALWDAIEAAKEAYNAAVGDHLAVSIVHRKVHLQIDREAAARDHEQNTAALANTGEGGDVNG